MYAIDMQVYGIALQPIHQNREQIAPRESGGPSVTVLRTLGPSGEQEESIPYPHICKGLATFRRKSGLIAAAPKNSPVTLGSPSDTANANCSQMGMMTATATINDSEC